MLPRPVDLNLVAAAGVAPDVLVNANDGDAVKAVRAVDEDTLAVGEDRAVGGAPRHRQGLGEAGDGEVLADQPDQRPPERCPRQLGRRFGGPAGVLSPDVAAADALLAADRDQQRRRAPAQRLVQQLPRHRVPRPALATAHPATLVGPDDPAGEHRPVRLESLSEDLEAELVQAGRTWSGRGARR